MHNQNDAIVLTLAFGTLLLSQYKDWCLDSVSYYVCAYVVTISSVPVVVHGSDPNPIHTKPAKVIQMPYVSFCTVIKHTWAPHPLQDATDDWMRASSSAALVQWPSPARHTAQTGFCGRKHSWKQLWQNLTRQKMWWWQGKQTTETIICFDLADTEIRHHIMSNGGRSQIPVKLLNRFSCKSNGKSPPQEGAGTCSLFKQLDESKQLRSKLQLPGEASSLM